MGWIAGLFCVVLLGYAVWTYNRLVALRKRADGAWSDIDVQLKRRWDLVPALVASVRGYAAHESSTLEGVVAARSQAERPASVERRGVAERNLTRAVGDVIAVAEAYPNLKADRNFIALQTSLVEVEDNIQYARRYYNAVVRDLNTLVAGFPSLVVARLGRFGEREYFQLDDAERAVPQVRL